MEQQPSKRQKTEDCVEASPDSKTTADRITPEGEKLRFPTQGVQPRSTTQGVQPRLTTPGVQHRLACEAAPLRMASTVRATGKGTIEIPGMSSSSLAGMVKITMEWEAPDRSNTATTQMTIPCQPKMVLVVKGNVANLTVGNGDVTVNGNVGILNQSNGNTLIGSMSIKTRK